MSMTRVFFSLIVPVFNVELYLRCCLDSVISQTFIEFECILVDDGSPDDCPAICDEYVKKDSRFKVIHKENGGLSHARNTGIRAALGEYIVLLDSDDLFVNNTALENLYKTIEENKTEVLFNSNITILKGETVTFSDEFEAEFISGDTIQFYSEIKNNRKILLAGWLFTVQRNFLFYNDLFFKIGILHEDDHWMPRLICAVSKIGINHSPFYMYRIERPGSIKAILSPRRLFDQLTIIEDILNWLKTKNGKNNICQIVYKDRCIVLWYDIFFSIILLDKQYKEECFILLKKLKNISYVLLYDISLYNIVCYSLIHFFNGDINKYSNTIKIARFLKKIIRKLTGR